MFDKLNSDAGPPAQAAYLGENISLLFDGSRSLRYLEILGIQSCLFILPSHFSNAYMVLVSAPVMWA